MGEGERVADSAGWVVACRRGRPPRPRRPRSVPGAGLRPPGTSDTDPIGHRSPLGRRVPRRRRVTPACGIRCAERLSHGPCPLGQSRSSILARWSRDTSPRRLEGGPARSTPAGGSGVGASALRVSHGWRSRTADRGSTLRSCTARRGRHRHRHLRSLQLRHGAIHQDVTAHCEQPSGNTPAQARPHRRREPRARPPRRD